MHDVCKKVQTRLARSNLAMVKAHTWHSDLAKLDVQYIYTERDAVLLRAYEENKLKACARRPCLFLHYLGARQVNAEIMDPALQKTWEVSVVNLLPMHPASQQVCLQTLPQVLTELDVSISSGLSISDPPGV